MSAEELAAGYVYDRTVPFTYNGKEHRPPNRGVWFEIANTGYACRGWANANGVTQHLRTQLLRAGKRTDSEIEALDQVTSKSMRRTMAKIMSKKVTIDQLVEIGDWSTVEMARRYLMKMNLLSKEAPNLTDLSNEQVVELACVHFGTAQQAAGASRKQKKTTDRVPHKEKQHSAADLRSISKERTPCHERPAGAKNPLTMKVISPAV